MVNIEMDHGNDSSRMALHCQSNPLPTRHTRRREAPREPDYETGEETIMHELSQKQLIDWLVD